MYTTSFPWTLAPGLGEQTVYVQYISDSGVIVGNAEGSIDVTNSSAAPLPVITPQSTAGMSLSQMQSLLASLEAELQTLEAEASAATPSAFTRNLTLQSSGADVKMLQQFLNGQGFPVASQGSGSPGNETTYFGSKTQQALANFQKSVGITPASGYFGPITRAYINSHP